MNSRIENSKRNIIGLLLNKIVGLLLPFLTRTIMIYYLGSIYLGLNSLFTSVLSVLSLAELGISTAMVFSMYEPMAKEDHKTVCALLNLYKRIYFIIGVVILILGAAVMPFLPILINGDFHKDINIYIVYSVNLINAVIGYFLFSYKESILIASQRTDVVGIINTVVCIILNVGQSIILVLTRNYYVYCLILPLSTIIGMMARCFIVDKMYPYYSCKGYVDENTKSEIKKRVTGLFIYKLCDVLRFSLDSIVLSAFLGLTVLAKYNNYYYIMNAITGIMGVISTSITASVGNSIVKESQEKNYRDFVRIQLLYIWIAGFCSSELFCLYQPFMKIWVGNDLMFADSLILLFCLYFFINRWGDICFVYRQAAGLWWQDKIRPIVESLLNISLNIILVRIIGVAGVLVSTIIGLVFVNSIWGSRVLFKYYFNKYNQKKYIGRLLFYTIVTIFSWYVCFYLGQIFLSVTKCTNLWIEFVAKSIICAVISNCIFSFAYSRLPEFSDSKELVLKLIKKR